MSIKLYKGDRVYMHDCMEARGNENKVYECTTDSFENDCGDEVVFLDSVAGFFATEFLSKEKKESFSKISRSKRRYKLYLDFSECMEFDNFNHFLGLEKWLKGKYPETFKSYGL